jgi:hypothetical protein
MSAVRYLFNTPGEYVAFVKNDNLFAPDSTWLGVVKNGNIVYDTHGKYLGHLTEDDRVVTQQNVGYVASIARPMRPVRPLRPLRPLRRLRMPRLPSGYQDSFLHGQQQLVSGSVSHLNELLDSVLVAHDGTFLGKVTRNRFESDSLLNQFGQHGNRFGQYSIFNKYSQYGSEYSALSPFNRFSNTPPSFVKDGVRLSYLTTNQFVTPRIDPEQFQTWLERG